MQGLWESVKDAKRREGRTISEPNRKIPKRILAELQNNADTKEDADVVDIKSPITPLISSSEIQDSIVQRLNAQLQNIFVEREVRKKELEVIAWRERLHQLACDRSERVEDCGWDQRLCFGDEEIVEFGEGVMESYDEPHQPNGLANGNAEGQNTDVDEAADSGEWWCIGRKKCDRHAGYVAHQFTGLMLVLTQKRSWQKLRENELKAQRVSNEEALARLTTREREIRNRIEDIRHPQSRSTLNTRKFTVKLLNGNDEGTKKGKKKTHAVNG